MSAEKYGEYLDRLEKAQNDGARGVILVEASRDYEGLTTQEFVRLDNYCKKQMMEGRKRR